MADLARSPEQIGNAIRRARKKIGMSQSELGEKTGLRQGTISQIEKGHAAAKLETILAVLSALNLELRVNERTKQTMLADALRNYGKN
ncbi:MAG: helix-turn-helix domain-containing protein [Alphaproteobacteria bacterium]